MFFILNSGIKFSSASSVDFFNNNFYQFKEYWYIKSMELISDKAKNIIAIFLASSVYLSLSTFIEASRVCCINCCFFILLASCLVLSSVLISKSSSRIRSGSVFWSSSRVSFSNCNSFFSLRALASIKLSSSCSRSYFSMDTTRLSIWSFKPDSVIAKFTSVILTQVSGEKWGLAMLVVI